LEDIEQELLKSIGMESHHRLSVTHNNTANFHIHIAINRIDPETLKLIDPWQSKKKLDRKSIELEEKHHLQKDNHAPNDLLKQAGVIFEDIKYSKSKDIEIHSGNIHSMMQIIFWVFHGKIFGSRKKRKLKRSIKR
jgi:hypothetical protein